MNFWILCLSVLLSFAASHAAETNAFLARTFTNSEGRTLSYRLLPPKNYDAQRAYPVLLYLHGAAARGSDNAEPLKWGPLLLGAGAVTAKHSFFLVVPQCPRGGGWVESGFAGLGGPKEGEALRLALDLVGEVLPKEFNIDPKRRYLTGVSMGGHAVWVVLTRRPGFFAAAVPVCAGGNPALLTKAAAKFPVWAFHSDDDHLVPVSQAREMVKAWRAHGGLAKYTEYTGVRHSSWKPAYADAEMFDWLFQQSLP